MSVVLSHYCCKKNPFSSSLSRFHSGAALFLFSIEGRINTRNWIISTSPPPSHISQATYIRTGEKDPARGQKRGKSLPENEKKSKQKIEDLLLQPSYTQRFKDDQDPWNKADSRGRRRRRSRNKGTFTEKKREKRSRFWSWKRRRRSFSLSQESSFFALMSPWN